MSFGIFGLDIHLKTKIDSPPEQVGHPEVPPTVWPVPSQVEPLLFASMGLRYGKEKKGRSRDIRVNRNSLI